VTKARIFDPFFTTKFTGRGLGLSAVLGIIRGHKGLISVKSETGVGTTFEALLPVSASSQTPPVPASRAESKPDRTGAILVVDDEEMVRAVTGAALKRRGYQVLTASNGREAVKAIGEHRDEIVAVILDLTMPVMAGAETLVQLRRIYPSLPVIGSSGYDESEAASQFGAGVTAFLKKPYTAADVTDTVASVLRHR